MLTVYFMPGTVALASHIALAESGAVYEARRVDFTQEEQRQPAYLAVNPKGRVPALETPQGVLTETPAILAWIAQSHPEARLAPLDDPFEFARLQGFTAYLCATVHVAHAHGRRGPRWADDEAAWEAMKRKVPDSMGQCFALIESDFLAGPWVMGEDYSIADPYLYTVSRWLAGDGVDIARFPKVQAHFEAMAHRPAVKRALAEEGLEA
jgi:glutathione S-transferase